MVAYPDRAKKKLKNWKFWPNFRKANTSRQRTILTRPVVVRYLKVWQYSRRDKHKYVRLKKGMRLNKERHELIFRIQSNIYDGAFLQKQFTSKSLIVDIRPGYLNIPLMNEINFLVFKWKLLWKLLLYFRYSYVFYRSTTLEKLERFGTLPAFS